MVIWGAKTKVFARLSCHVTSNTAVVRLPLYISADSILHVSCQDESRRERPRCEIFLPASKSEGTNIFFSQGSDAGESLHHGFLPPPPCFPLLAGRQQRWSPCEPPPAASCGECGSAPAGRLLADADVHGAAGHLEPALGCELRM